MFYLFLDIDGVAFTWLYGDSTEGPRRFGTNTECVSNLNVLIREIRKRSDLTIVLISSYRILLVTEEKIREFLSVAGIKVSGSAIDRTGNIGNRAEEIRAFIEENEVGQYLVIDDDADMSIENTVKPKFLTGFTSRDLEKAMKILESQTARKK